MIRFDPRILLLCLLIGAGAAPSGAAPASRTQTETSRPPSQRELARDIFRELIEIDTTHRQGTGVAVQAMAARLRAAGFSESDLLLDGPRPERLNLVARLPGRGHAEPVLFFAHLDVVEALKEDWSPDIDPFRFTERDGFFYGRGTVDVKDEAASLVANLIRLRREGFIPDRDIVVALTADEEGGADDGVDWLVRNRPEWIRAAYCINTDAGGGQVENGKRLRYTVQTSEKASISFRLEVTNPGGHSSQPVKENAIYRLAEGLSRLAKHEFPAKLNETTRLFLERMSAIEKGQTAADLKAAAQIEPDPAAVARLSEASPFFSSVMRTTCVATMLEAGHAFNALPQTARAIVNCRVLPEDSQEGVTAALRDVLADSQISITPLNDLLSSPASPIRPDVFETVERLVAEMWPGVPVVPVMDPWATDGVFLRRAGVAVYGAPGIFYEIDPIRSHGKDERIGVEAFHEGVEFTYRLMKALTARQ